MVEVKSLLIDGEPVHLFRSAVFLFQSEEGWTLELDGIVSEVAVRKYEKIDRGIAEIELEDGRVFSQFMDIQVFMGKLPQLQLYCEVGSPDEYKGFPVVSENESFELNLDEGLTLTDIRKVEMPNEKVRLTLELPIDQAEWLAKQKKKDINALFKDIIAKLMR